MTATMTSRQFNQDASGAKRAAAEGPVVITDRGRPAHVLMTFEEYQRLSGTKPTIVDLIGMQPTGTELDDIDFDPPRSRALPRIVDFD